MKPIVITCSYQDHLKSLPVASKGILDPETVSNFTTDREVSTSIAALVCDVCKQNPDRGVDLILSVSSCIESRDSVVQALGLESLSYLCEADILSVRQTCSYHADFTAWKVISKELLDYSVDPTVSPGVCFLLRWGAMDAEAHSETSKNLIQILWSIATYKKSNVGHLWIKARGTAFHSLSQYKVSLIQDVPDFWSVFKMLFLISGVYGSIKPRALYAMCKAFSLEDIEFDFVQCNLYVRLASMTN